MSMKNLKDFDKCVLKLKKKMSLAYPTHLVVTNPNTVSVMSEDYQFICKYNNNRKLFFAFCTEQGINVDSLDDGMDMIFKFCKTWKFMQGFEQ